MGRVSTGVWCLGPSSVSSGLGLTLLKNASLKDCDRNTSGFFCRDGREKSYFGCYSNIQFIFQTRKSLLDEHVLYIRCTLISGLTFLGSPSLAVLQFFSVSSGFAVGSRSVGDATLRSSGSSGEMDGLFLRVWKNRRLIKVHQTRSVISFRSEQTRKTLETLTDVHFWGV